VDVIVGLTEGFVHFVLADVDGEVAAGGGGGGGGGTGGPPTGRRKPHHPN